MTNAPRAREGIDWDWLSSWVTRYFLPLWFVTMGLRSMVFLIGNPASIGFDIRLYQASANAWLGGQSPWEPYLFLGDLPQPFSYAGPPITLLPFLIFSWVPPDALILAVVLAAAASMVWTLRRLGLPIWWMLFPPIVEGIWVGNLNIFVIALLVLGGTAAGALAVVLKVYAGVPLLLMGRWRPIAVAGVVVLVTAPLLPWQIFIANYGAITAALAEQSWGGHTNLLTTPLATVAGAIALIMLGRERAIWLVVPVLWPSTQLHYSVIALPAFAISPILAIPGSAPEPGFLTAGVIVLALWERRELVWSLTKRRPNASDNLSMQDQ